jgi:hypothetical protein
MDEIHIDTVRIRALPTRFTFPCGTVFEQLGDGTFKKSDLAGHHNGYVVAEAITYYPTEKEQYLAYRQSADRDADRILDQGIDRTPQVI